MSDKLYGIVISRQDGEPLNEGYSLDGVIELANSANECEVDLYDLTNDLAIAPKLLLDMASHIKELEAKLGSQNIQTES